MNVRVSIFNECSDATKYHHLIAQQIFWLNEVTTYAFNNQWNIDILRKKWIDKCNTSWKKLPFLGEIDTNELRLCNERYVESFDDRDKHRLQLSSLKKRNTLKLQRLSHLSCFLRESKKSDYNTVHKAHDLFLNCMCLPSHQWIINWFCGSVYQKHFTILLYSLHVHASISRWINSREIFTLSSKRWITGYELITANDSSSIAREKKSVRTVLNTILRYRWKFLKWNFHDFRK